jgi:2-phospho-L-lactate/phosphoenolpyruvate guanylyltransferase
MPNPNPNAAAPTGRPGPVVAIVPVGALEGAKSRLGAVLDAEERLELTLRLARGTIAACVGARGIAETLVITPDDAIRRLAEDLGARPIRQRDGGLNRGIETGRDEALAAGASAILVLPIDLPEVTADAIDAVVATLATSHRPLVAIVPDRHGRGTNALLVAPPDAIGFCFGGDSRHAHAAAARAAGAELIELGGPLTLDLDTPDDLLLAESTLRSADDAEHAAAEPAEATNERQSQPVDVG